MNAATPVQAGGVVFDCDGVLANTTSCWEEAFAAAAGKFGLVLGSEHLADLRGAALRTAACRIAAWSQRSPVVDDVLEVLRGHLVVSIDASQLMLIEGVRELLAELHGRVRLGVARRR
jgi:phosphoglycolate phosphatase-like HAD superfamily hydrolase